MNTQLIPYDQMERMAHSLVKSRMFGLDNIDQAMALMAIAQAEGKHPAIIARDFHIIQGRPAKKVDAMLRDFQASGGRIVRWNQLDDTAAEGVFTHPLGGEVTIRWDIERAKKAGLAGKADGMYAKYPRQMLRSRTISEAIRTLAPGATSGVYSSDEIRDMAAEVEAEEKNVTPPPPKLDERQVADHLAAIESTADLDDLKHCFQVAYSAAKAVGDFAAVEKFERKKDARKRDLTAEDVSP